MKAKFGLGIATGTEGLMYPIPYSSLDDVIELSVLAEKLGFDAVWGNDHLTTQSYVWDEFQKQPRYYAPLLTLAAIARETKTLKVATALLVIPFRHPLVVAKELVTLELIAKGRLYIGVGLGAYREEFEAQFGDRSKKMHRGKMLNESLEVINRLFNERSVSFDGEYFQLTDAVCYPKPDSMPFPFYIGGNSTNSFQRVEKYGTGWLPALLTPDEVRKGKNALEKIFSESERSFNEIDIAPQLAVSIAKTHEEAIEKYERSQMYKHSVSLQQSTMKGRDASNYLERNLIGSVEEVEEMVERYIEAGVTNFSALIFTDNTVEETKEHMQLFSETIIKKYGE